ncbi:DUF4350 domain-containing protein [Sabulilitoribacter arenilitoris]|uniref:DUF4350 domain-containing protein n=1 Tax=Wocania arenilitoris TaxID=2044858 RepID=A0AAE3ET42_9FLAO|nr:DUF4350 domain-containing protein [Wocania arenilitoris]MCF7569640.1 DUF4350 domain-containing protein [Wocania arenilitoris]
MKTLLILIILILPICSFSQQVADTLYNPKIQNTVYENGEGPTVFIDEGHHNFHTKNGRYKAFSNLLERDGYNVKEYKGKFNENDLSKGKILVISNALNEINVEDWVLPNPSAFSKSEIEAVKKWVNSGGSLFLIADHMPMAGAAKDLAMEFEFEFTNGFVFDTINRGPAYFNLKEKTLAESIITKGRNSFESVNQIATFTGQAFKIPDDANPILTFNKNYVNMLPDTAWVFDKNTTKYNVEGWSQGAYKKYGKGRIVVFGEAAMFSAQLAGPKKRKMGMNNKVAPENYQLLLNIIHWLDGVIE